MRETLAVGRRQDHGRGRSALRRDVLDGRKQRLRLQHHPGAAAKRHVVDHPVPIGRVIAQIVDAHIESSTRDRAADNPLRERRVDHLREDRDDVDLHRALPGSSVFIRGSLCRRSIHVEQPFGRIDRHASRRDVHRDADPLNERDHDVPVDHQVAAVERPLDAGDASRGTVPLVSLHVAPDQVVTVERAIRQRFYHRLRQPDICAGQQLGIVHGVDPGKPHDRTPLVKPNLDDLVVAWSFGGANLQHLSGPETLLHEVRFGIDDDLPANAVRPRNSSDQQQALARQFAQPVHY